MILYTIEGQTRKWRERYLKIKKININGLKNHKNMKRYSAKPQTDK
jgi:hypothetical protein